MPFSRRVRDTRSVDQIRLEIAAAGRLASLRGAAKTPGELRSAAALCREQAQAYSAEMLRCHADRKQLALRRANDRRSTSRRQALTELIARYGEMAAKWNELAEFYERRAGDAEELPPAA
jgi:hypothetical protein